MKHFSLIFSFCSLCLIGCSQPKQNAPEPQPETEQETVEVPDHAIPAQNGVFVRHQDEFQPIPDGKKDKLVPTNAERGFGFALPLGQNIDNIQDLTIQSTSLNPEMLQITEFTGVASDVSDSLQEVGDDSVAWLPDKTHTVTPKIWDKTKGLMDLHLDSPLKPGFYVLHDETLFRARQNSEVTAYYPFVIMDAKSKNMPWTLFATECFDDILKKNGPVPSLDNPSEKLSNAVQECIQKQRIAWKTVSSEATRIYPQRILLLRRFVQPGSSLIQERMIAEQNPEGTDLEILIWQTTHADHLMQLKNLRQKILSGQKPSTTTTNPVIQYYLGKSGENQLLESLTWMPFAQIDSSDSHLEELFDLILQNQPYDEQLIDLIAALEYRKIQATVNQTHKHADWFKKFTTGMPKNWVEISSQIKVNANAQNLIFGPFVFENIDPSEQSAWISTIKSKYRDVRACIQPKSLLESTLFVMDQPLNHSGGIGADNSGVLRDPIAETRSIPVILPEAVHCITRVFESLPGEPSLEANKRVKFGITIIKGQ